MQNWWINIVKSIVKHFGWQQYFEKDKKMLETMGYLFARENKIRKLHQFYYEKMAVLSIMLLVVIAVGILCFLSEPSGELKEGYYLERGEMDEEISLVVSMEGKINNTEIQTEIETKIPLPARKLTKKEKQELLLQGKDYLDKVILGKNSDINAVSKNLYFPESISETGVHIEWFTDDNYITKEGRIRKKKIPAGGIHTIVEAKMVYRNLEGTLSFPLHLISGERMPEEEMQDMVRSELKNIIREQKTEPVAKLPDQINQVQISYQDPGSEKDYTPLLAAGLIPILYPFIWRDRQKKKLLQRERELLSDHPGFINQIMLLLSAGLTIRGAIERLVSDYDKDRKKGKSFRYLYEELWVVCNQMQNGISEKRAIEAFGKRCHIMPYMRFSSIVSQNLKKGSYGLIPLLEADAKESFQRRIETVKKLGEEAGTKMLFPMMLMLALVMGILMIPAFMSM
ncbi:MAG: hypothetical protein LBR68_05745 [Lachnoclostridium sp.]|jgi:uncharacterized protein YuzE|nr:hypothetical protein [Lachnoclostridium sp.]